MIQLDNNVPYNDHFIQRAHVRLVFLFFYIPFHSLEINCKHLGHSLSHPGT